MAGIGSSPPPASGRTGDRGTRQDAADRALAVARQLSRSSPAPDSALAAAVIVARVAAADLMTFAGVEREWPAYPSEHGMIWGITERILTEFLSLVD